jgi:2-haloalkanoic acid dehalogenase type II
MVMGTFDEFAALSFDCYGTLIDWETGISEALAPWAEASGLVSEGAGLIETFGRFETVVESEHPEMVYPAVLFNTLRRMSEHFEVPFSVEIGADFGASVGRWPVFPDSAEALSRLQKRFKLIILSNIDRGSFALSNARLQVDFDLVITAQDVGAYKPELRGFQRLFDSLGSIGVERSQHLHVAQSLFHDHEPARELGIPSVWIDRRHDREGFGATPAPKKGTVEPTWRFESMKAFADAALGADS